MKAFAAIFLLLCAPLMATTPGDELRSRLVTAVDGETIHVDAGVYEGPFVIEKPVHLIGRSGAVLRGNRETHVVMVRAAGVELAGFIVRGSGRDLGKDHAAIYITGSDAFIHDNEVIDSLHGIYVRKATHIRIENNRVYGDGAVAQSVNDPLAGGLKPGESELCDIESVQDRRGNGIHLWNSRGHIIAGNVIRGTRDGIYFSFTDETVVRDNTIENVRYGLHYMYSDDNVFERNLFTGNAAGSALMYSKGLVLRENRFVANRSHRAYGLLFQSVDNTRVEANVIEGNTLGFYLENSNHVTVLGNRIVGNYVGLRVSDSTTDSAFSENNFHGNIHPVETNGRNIANAWAVAGRGNSWEGAMPVDLNRDGVADVSHREADLFGSWRRSFPAVGLLSASPGERLLRFIHSRLALPGLPGVTDPKPLLTQNRKSSP